VIVSVVDHLDFTRIGADLYMKKSITLLEALTGFKSSFTHLDGSVFNMETTPGEIINFVDKKTMYGMGMPFFKDPMIHGNLIIEF
jgi:DnaJ-class molecular chaperone